MSSIDSTEHSLLALRGMHELWTSGRFLDVTLSCEDGSLRAHRLVLAATSSYFRQHLTSDVQEIRVPSLLRHLETVLLFMYTGYARMKAADLMAVTTLATTLGVQGLAITPDKKKTRDVAPDSLAVAETADLEELPSSALCPPDSSDSDAEHESTLSDMTTSAIMDTTPPDEPLGTPPLPVGEMENKTPSLPICEIKNKSPPLQMGEMENKTPPLQMDELKTGEKRSAANPIATKPAKVVILINSKDKAHCNRVLVPSFPRMLPSQNVPFRPGTPIKLQLLASKRHMPSSSSQRTEQPSQAQSKSQLSFTPPMAVQVTQPQKVQSTGTRPRILRRVRPDSGVSRQSKSQQAQRPAPEIQQPLGQLQLAEAPTWVLRTEDPFKGQVTVKSEIQSESEEEERTSEASAPRQTFAQMPPLLVRQAPQAERSSSLPPPTLPAVTLPAAKPAPMLSPHTQHVATLQRGPRSQQWKLPPRPLQLIPLSSTSAQQLKGIHQPTAPEVLPGSGARILQGPPRTYKPARRVPSSATPSSSTHQSSPALVPRVPQQVAPGKQLSNITNRPASVLLPPSTIPQSGISHQTVRPTVSAGTASLQSTQTRPVHQIFTSKQFVVLQPAQVLMLKAAMAQQTSQVANKLQANVAQATQHKTPPATNITLPPGSLSATLKSTMAGQASIVTKQPAAPAVEEFSDDGDDRYDSSHDSSDTEWEHASGVNYKYRSHRVRLSASYDWNKKYTRAELEELREPSDALDLEEPRITDVRLRYVRPSTKLRAQRRRMAATSLQDRCCATILQNFRLFLGTQQPFAALSSEAVEHLKNYVMKRLGPVRGNHRTVLRTFLGANTQSLDFNLRINHQLEKLVWTEQTMLQFYEDIVNWCQNLLSLRLRFYYLDFLDIEQGLGLYSKDKSDGDLERLYEPRPTSRQLCGFLARLSNLHTLCLTKCSIGDNEMAAIGENCLQLVDLDVSHNFQVTNKGIAKVCLALPPNVPPRKLQRLNITQVSLCRFWEWEDPFGVYRQKMEERKAAEGKAAKDKTGSGEGMDENVEEEEEEYEERERALNPDIFHLAKQNLPHLVSIKCREIQEAVFNMTRSKPFTKPLKWEYLVIKGDFIQNKLYKERMKKVCQLMPDTKELVIHGQVLGSIKPLKKLTKVEKLSIVMTDDHSSCPESKTMMFKLIQGYGATLTKVVLRTCRMFEMDISNIGYHCLNIEHIDISGRICQKPKYELNPTRHMRRLREFSVLNYHPHGKTTCLPAELIRFILYRPTLKVFSLFGIMFPKYAFACAFSVAKRGGRALQNLETLNLKAMRRMRVSRLLDVISVAPRLTTLVVYGSFRQRPLDLLTLQSFVRDNQLPIYVRPEYGKHDYNYVSPQEEEEHRREEDF